MEAEAGIEPANVGFANRCLTTWLLRRDTYRVGGDSLRFRAMAVNAGVLGESSFPTSYPNSPSSHGRRAFS